MGTEKGLRTRYRFEAGPVGAGGLAYVVSVYRCPPQPGSDPATTVPVAEAVVFRPDWFAVRPGEADPGALRVLWPLPPPVTPGGPFGPEDWDAAALEAVRQARDE